MIVTRCPACQAAFRVTPEQLRMRQGKVRCGKCRSVFNALESLVYQADSAAPASASEAVTEQKPAEEARTPTMPEAAQAEAPPPAEPAPQTEDTPSATPALPWPALDTPESKADTAGALVQDGEAAGDALMAQARDELPAMPEQEAAEPDGSQTTRSVPETAESSQAKPAIAPAPTPPRTTEAEAPSVALDDDNEDGLNPPTLMFDGDTAGVTAARELPARRTWLWPAAVALAALVLVLQALFVFRSELAVVYPGLRAPLAAACRTLGCELPLPRKPELVSIEASDLHPDRGNRALLLLQATIKNRAPFPQAYPLLELTLTDARDDALVRRVFEPSEYLPPGSDATRGFAPNGEVALSLRLDARQVPATGYRLYVFYP